MGLLNHLFGGKKGIAKELVMDDKKRLTLWKQHLSNYYKREQLCKNFNFKNIDKALQDFDATDRILSQIEELISPELISISEEEKLDKEILADLERLKSAGENEQLSDAIIYEENKQSALLSLFHEIHDVLIRQLYLIRLIRKRHSNVKDLLLQLFTLINHKEDRLYLIFREENFEDKSKHAKFSRLVKSVILQQEFKEEIETAEEKFARKMLKKMTPGESRSHYRKLGEDIFYVLLEGAGAPLEKGEDVAEGIERMEKLMKDDAVLFGIIKKLRPKYDKIKIMGVILAFRKAYDFGHFEDLESEFVT